MKELINKDNLTTSEIIRTLINQKFIELGDIVGDFLFLKENQEIVKENNSSHISQIQNSINNCSNKADDILSKHRLALVNEIIEASENLAQDLQNFKGQNINCNTNII